nr:isoform 2 of probable adp-ribosylation factor gtpase-activating protein agd14 [Quercus suber]
MAMVQASISQALTLYLRSQSAAGSRLRGDGAPRGSRASESLLLGRIPLIRVQCQCRVPDQAGETDLRHRRRGRRKDAGDVPGEGKDVGDNLVSLRAKKEEEEERKLGLRLERLTQKGEEIKWEVRVRGEGTKLTQLIEGLTEMGGDGVCVENCGDSVVTNGIRAEVGSSLEGVVGTSRTRNHFLFICSKFQEVEMASRKEDEKNERIIRGLLKLSENRRCINCNSMEVEMASRKEDEKNERIIRGLLKLSENRRCINCNSMGPQYVCTNFWTFVCTTCSGIHREFTHRVKSVSMAKFTSQEVTALQEGGNKHAKEIYFKELDPQRHSVPDSSNVERLRDFIKHVYVDRRYTGERNYDKPPRVKMGEKEELYENRRTDAYQGGSRSPQYEDTYERRYSGRSSPGGRSYEERSPGYEQESRQYGDYKRSPVRPEIVSDWHREDRFGNGRRVEDRRESDGDSKLEGRSPEQPKDLNSSSPPMVRPVREILGENVIPLRISEPPKANGGRSVDGFSHTQRTASSSSLGSSNGNPVEVKVENSGSLIDFDADPAPPIAAAVPQAQQTFVTQPTGNSATSTNDNNWASFDVAPEPKVSQAPSNVNTLDVLSQLSVSVSAPGHVSGNPAFAPVGNIPALPFTAGAPVASPISSVSAFPPGGAPAIAPGLMPILPVNGGVSFAQVPGSGQAPNLQHQQPSFFPATGSQSTAHQFTPSVDLASGNQQWNSSLTTNSHGPSSAPAGQAPQAFSKPVNVPTSSDVSQSSARKALPEDLFAATSYSHFAAPVPGWQMGPPHGMGFAMQYAMPAPTFQQSKSSNPFDLSSEPPSVQASMFPSMAPLQGALPNVQPASGLMRTSSYGTPSSVWMAPQAPPYASALPPPAPSYVSAVPPRAYMVQQVPGNMPHMPPSGHQGLGGLGNDGAAFSSLNMDQQLAGRFSAPATPNPYSSASGNPFG